MDKLTVGKIQDAVNGLPKNAPIRVEFESAPDGWNVEVFDMFQKDGKLCIVLSGWYNEDENDS